MKRGVILIVSVIIILTVNFTMALQHESTQPSIDISGIKPANGEFLRNTQTVFYFPYNNNIQGGEISFAFSRSYGMNGITRTSMPLQCSPRICNATVDAGRTTERNRYLDYEIKIIGTSGNNATYKGYNVIDFDVPQITLTGDSYVKNNELNLTFMVRDKSLENSCVGGCKGKLNPNVTCELYFDNDNTVRASIQTTLRKNSLQSNTSGLDEGYHNYTIKCRDVVLREAVTLPTAFLIDKHPPVISSEHPVNNSYMYPAIIFYNVKDDLSDISSILYDDEGKKGTLTTTKVSGLSYRYVVYADSLNWSDGKHNLVLYVNDSLNNMASYEFVYYVDSKAPDILVTLPENSSFNNGNMSVDFHAVEELSPAVDCYMFVDRQVSSYANLKGNQTYSDKIIVGEGSHEFSVQCYDYASNVGASEIIHVITDRKEPSVSLELPENNTITSFYENRFRFSVEENNIASCSLIVSDGNGSEFSDNLAVINSSSEKEINHSFINDGIYYWGVECEDKATNKNDYRSSIRKIIIDTTEPAIISTGPSTGTQLNSGTTEAVIGVSTTEVSLCKYFTIFRDWSNMTLFNTTNMINHTARLADLSDGMSYLYMIKCQDVVGNLMKDYYNLSFSVNSAQSQETGSSSKEREESKVIQQQSQQATPLEEQSVTSEQLRPKEKENEEEKINEQKLVEQEQTLQLPLAEEKESSRIAVLTGNIVDAVKKQEVLNLFYLIAGLSVGVAGYLLIKKINI